MMMKKKNVLFLSLGMLLAASNCFAARLTITNNSKETVWARINDQNRVGLSPEEKKQYKQGLLLSFHFIGWMMMFQVKNSPAFKKIKPGTATVFHSGLAKPITKLTFLNPVGSKTERIERKSLKPKQIYDSGKTKVNYPNPTMTQLSKQYGNLYAFEKEIEGIPSTVYINMYNKIGKIYTKPNIEVTFPVIETFTIKPNIKATNLNAKINYRGWKQTERY